MSPKAEITPQLFLDNTIQVTRLLGPSTRRRMFNQILTQVPQAYTTSYVWMEYQRTVVSDFAHVHHILSTESEWGTAVARIATGQRLFRPRSLVRVNRIFGETLNRSHMDREKGLQFLATYLEHRLDYLFWSHVTSLPDPIACDLVTEGIQRQTDGTYTVAERCRKEKATCHLPDFLAEKRSALEAITHYLATHPKSIKKQARVEQLLDAVRSDPRAALGQTACWPLGDLIIALQVPPDAALWTLDPDFKPLAAALGLQLHEPPQITA